MCGFPVTLIMTLKVKQTMLFLNIKVDFNKNEMESRMENHKNAFRATNLVLQFEKES